MEIQADLADGNRMAFVQPGRQCIDICWRMVCEETRVQSIGRMQFDVTGAECLDAWPTALINGRNDHRLDSGLARALEDGVAIVGEGVVIEMDVAVDEFVHVVVFVRWQRVRCGEHKHNATDAS
jgi:hypothetical protein